MFDVVGVGANSVDYVYRLPEFPKPDSPAAKLRIAHHALTCGGQTATALCTCAAMGLRARYVGATGNDDNGHLIREELSRRKPHGYPPYRNMLQASLSGKKEDVVEGAAGALAEWARAAPGAESAVEVLGPAPAPVRRVRDRFRWQLLLLGDRNDVRRVALQLQRRARAELSGVDLRLDTAPLQML